MLKKIFLFAGLFSVCSLAVFAQKLQLSVEGGMQQSWIPNYVNKADNAPCSPYSGYCFTTTNSDVEYSYQEKPGGYLKALLAYNAKERLQIYQSLGLHLLRFRAEVITPANTYLVGTICLDENGQAGPCENWTEPAYRTDDRVGETTILYLGQELGIRYKLFEKVWLQSGVDISYRLHSQMYGYSLEYTSGSSWNQPVTTQLSVEKDRSGEGINAVVTGLHAGVAYTLTDKLSLTLAIQHSLTPFYNYEFTTGKGYEQSKSNLLRLGVQYRLKSW